MNELLLPDLKLVEERKDKVSQLFFQIEKSISTGNKTEANNAINELNAYVGKDYKEEDFYEYWSYTDEATIIRNISLPEIRNLKISKEDLIEILHLIKSNDSFMEYYLKLLTNNFPYGDKVFGLIGENIPVEKMAEVIFTYQPIML